VEIETREWKPEQRRRRYVEFAEDAVEHAARPFRRTGPIDSTELLERIETRRTRFRALLATSGGRS
jgi:hypothetical protein